MSRMIASTSRHIGLIIGCSLTVLVARAGALAQEEPNRSAPGDSASVTVLSETGTDQTAHAEARANAKVNRARDGRHDESEKQKQEAKPRQKSNGGSRRIGAGIGVVLKTDGGKESKETESGDQRRESPEVPPKRLWLGVQVKEPSADLAAFLGNSAGLFVVAVSADSPAAQAGIQPGDVLVEVDGRPLREPQDLVKALAVSGQQDEPDAIKLKVLRRNQVRTVEVIPGERPKGVGIEAEIETLIERITDQLGEKNLEADASRLLEELREALRDRVNGKDGGLQLFQFGDPARIRMRWNRDRKSGADRSSDTDSQEFEVIVGTDEQGNPVQIQIERTGDGPMKVTVRGEAGEKTFEVESLEDLPDEERELIELAKGGGIEDDEAAGQPHTLWWRMDFGDLSSKLHGDLSEQIREMAERLQRRALEDAERARAAIRQQVVETDEKVTAQDSTARQIAELKETVKRLEDEIERLRNELRKATQQDEQ